MRAMSAHVGAMLAHLGAMLAHLGAMMAHLGAILAHLGRYVGPSWGYVGPSCGLCWPMLTHLKPQDPKKCGKSGKSTKTTVKQDVFWPYRVVCGWGGGPSLLWRGEKRLRLCHGQGAPGRI